MLDAADRVVTTAAQSLQGVTASVAPQLRLEIFSPDEYGIPLPEWLRQCIDHVPPGRGETCPTDPEALLASAFDFAYQLHRRQVRATGEPYIIHPVAVADLLRDIGASAAVIAAGFLHDVVEDTDVSLEEIEAHFGREVRTPARAMQPLIFRCEAVAPAGGFGTWSLCSVSLVTVGSLRRGLKPCLLTI